MKRRPRNVELRQKGKHYTVVDDTGRTYARETDPVYAEREYKRALTGLGKELGNKVGPKKFDEIEARAKHKEKQAMTREGMGIDPRKVAERLAQIDFKADPEYVDSGAVWCHNCESFEPCYDRYHKRERLRRRGAPR